MPCGFELRQHLNRLLISLETAQCQPFQLLYTDGFPEAMSPQGELFGNQRLLEIVHSHRDQSTREILDLLFAEIRQFSDPAPLLDDATAVLLKVLAET